MKRSFGLLILLVLFVAGCACPSVAPMPEPSPPVMPEPGPPATPEPSPQPPPAASLEYARQLAEQFCPVIYLKGEETAENFEPEQIEIMVDDALLRDIEDPAFFEKATLPGLLQWSQSVYYLDLADLEPGTHSSAQYKLAYDQLNGQYQPTLYARVREGESYTVVQYWIFYYFNDWRNLHEGDWELVQLCFPGQTAKELMENGEQPVFAAYSQHQAGQKMSWSDMKMNGLVEGAHPVVHVARGSHANYFTPGNYWSGLDFDNTGTSSWTVISPEQFSLVLLPEIEAGGEELEWLGFKGHWGEYLGFSISVLGLKFWQRGPFGPPWSEGEQASKSWGHPEEWAAGLAEYPQPFWTSFFELPGDWFNRAFFCLFSPANIHVYDSLGRHVGINERGEIETQIPGALYFTPEGTQYKTIIIPEADISQEYVLVVSGTDSGVMDIKTQVPDAETRVRHYLEYTNVPVSATTTARIRITPDRVVNLELDSNGDGVFELESTPGNFEAEKVEPVPPEANIEANIDIEPDTLDPTSVAADKFITAYIQLPKGYNPKSIDIRSVRLMEDIPVWEKVVDIVDHNQDGVRELMVQFDRQLVIDYLKRKQQIEGRVALTLTGAIDGRMFEGVDIILVMVRKTEQSEVTNLLNSISQPHQHLTS